MTNVYRTRMNKNLKKCAASCARPTIQYVLAIVPSVHIILSETVCTYIEDTIIVGITRSGITSKTKRDKSQAVGLSIMLQFID